MKDNYPTNYHQEPQYLSRYEHIEPHYSRPNVKSIFCGFLSGIGWVIVAGVFGFVALALAAACHSWEVKKPFYDERFFQFFDNVLTTVGIFITLAAGFIFYGAFATKSTAKESVLSTDDNYTFPVSLKEKGTRKFNDAVIERRNQLIDLGTYTLTKLSMDVFGNKGNHYTQQLEQILEDYEDE